MGTHPPPPRRRRSKHPVGICCLCLLWPQYVVGGRIQTEELIASLPLPHPPAPVQSGSIIRQLFIPHQSPVPSCSLVRKVIAMDSWPREYGVGGLHCFYISVRPRTQAVGVNQAAANNGPGLASIEGNQRERTIARITSDKPQINKYRNLDDEKSMICRVGSVSSSQARIQGYFSGKDTATRQFALVNQGRLGSWVHSSVIIVAFVCWVSCVSCATIDTVEAIFSNCCDTAMWCGLREN